MKKYLLTALLLAACMPCLFCGAAQEKSVPEELVGTWASSDARYGGRFFELTPTSVMRIGIGGDNVDLYTIQAIESIPQDALTLYTITYLNATGYPYEFKFTYDPFDGGIIVFVNQDDMKWTREEQ